MEKDREFIADLLNATAKILAQEAIHIRVIELGNSISNENIAMINSAARCVILAQKYRKGERG